MSDTPFFHLFVVGFLLVLVLRALHISMKLDAATILCGCEGDLLVVGRLRWITVVVVSCQITALLVLKSILP